MKWLNVFFITLSIGFASMVIAANSPQEIDFLISAVAESDCTFHRNGFDYSSKRAAKHLQMKYSRGKQYLDTAEDFINVLATKSSITGKPYTITCEGDETEKVKDWLLKSLNDFRENYHEGQM